MKRWFRAIVPAIYAVICVYYACRLYGTDFSVISFGKLCLFGAGFLCNVLNLTRSLREEPSESLSFLSDACLILNFLMTLFLFSDLLLWFLSAAFFANG